MIIFREKLPDDFPTHVHSAEFWEQLGRTIATFGFLEEILGKAIFAFTATRQYTEDEIEAAYERWLPTLEKALIDSLSRLIEAYGKSIRDNKRATISGDELQSLLNELTESSEIRNVLCHASWWMPDVEGKSIPFFVNREKEVFGTPVDIEFLKQVRRHVVDLICEVIQSVADMGYQFPGSHFPGKKIW